jgi:hypothetical protein
MRSGTSNLSRNLRRMCSFNSIIFMENQHSDHPTRESMLLMKQTRF